MSEKLTLRAENRLEELGRIADEIEAMGRREDWPPTLVFSVNLAVEELVMNIIEHGHDGGLHEFEVSFNSEPDRLTVEITDDGRPFDPTREAPAPDLDSPLETRTTGGLGLHLVRSIVDEISYMRVSGENHTALVARRDRRPSAATPSKPSG